MSILSLEKEYKEFKTELKICKIGGLFLVLYRNKEVPKLIIKKLENDDDLEVFFHFPLYINETQVPFPILFEQTFKQMGKQSNIFHVLGIEKNLSSERAKEFLGYLQYARERLKAKPYSLVFWITPEFEKKLFFQAPDFHHWVFGTYDFTDIDDEQLKILISSVNKELFDVQKIDKYLEKVIWQYQNWEKVKKDKEPFLLELMERADLYTYYVQSYCIDKQGKEQLLDDLLDNFIEDSQQNFLTLLGDFGTGKTSFAIHYFIELAKKYLNDKTKRIPIFISLKDYKVKLNIEDFMVREFYKKFKITINFSIFQQLALQAKFIFFIDGFDEMASLTDRAITIQNLKELTKLSFENVLFMTQAQDKSYKANKVFLTSRTHYFLTESQERNILKADYTILYRNYATKSNYEINRIKLKEFNDKQIREYIQKHTNNEEITNQYLKIIEDAYNLKELSTRPLLLEMIIKTIDKFKEQKNINISDLYRAYTNIWIERDDWRSQMKPEGKRSFMWEIAVKMLNLGGNFSLHHSKLDRPKNEHLKSNFEVSDQDYYKYESTTCSFLNRDSDGNYKFIHKSFMEYFVAESFYYYLRKNNKRNNKVFRSFRYLYWNNEMKFFLNNMIELDKHKLSIINLSCLYLSQIDLSSASLNQTNLSDTDLSGANLSGADLNGTNLSYANLSDADLNGANLSYANLRGTKIDKKTVLDNKWNLVWKIINKRALDRDLDRTNLSDADLSYANLSGANLINADLNGANLSYANLSDANLSGADLDGADLSGADLNGTNLSNTYLSGAKLSGANLSNTYLIHTNLSGANLNGANLSNTYLFHANLSGSNLSDANLIKNKYLTSSQIKSACFWDQAFYKGYWDENKSKWIINEQANQKYIEQLKKSIG